MGSGCEGVNYVETREKRSSKIKRTRKTTMTIRETAHDLSKVIEELGLIGKDYLLVGSSYGGAVVLEGLIHGYLNPPTTIVHDPIVKWPWEEGIYSIGNRSIALVLG